MSEPITRDDLRRLHKDATPVIRGYAFATTVRVTDEELEPIIRSLGYVKIGTPIVAVDSPAFAQAVRERVNPTCPDCEGSGHDRRWKGYTPCSRCDGRGHLGVDLGRVREVLEFSSMVDLDTPIYQAARALLDLLGEEE